MLGKRMSVHLLLETPHMQQGTHHNKQTAKLTSFGSGDFPAILVTPSLSPVNPARVLEAIDLRHMVQS